MTVKTNSYNQNGYNTNFQSGFYVPDYAKAEEKQWDTEHTAELDGWLVVSAYAVNDILNPHIIIDTNLIVLCQCSTINTSVYTSLLFPIGKGQKYIAKGGYSYKKLLFMPLRKN